jgi:hypothetical protein
LDLLREAAEVWAAGEDDRQVGYLAKVFTQTSLPYKEPHPELRVWGRRNGDLVLTVTPGMTIDSDGEGRSIGFPYGTIPRLLLAWLSTQAVRHQTPELVLGDSLAEFMRELGMASTGGKNGTITRLRTQAERLFEATLTVKWEGDASRDAGGKLVVASAWDLRWNTTPDGQQSLLRSHIRLSSEFFSEVTRHPVPLDLRALRALRGSALRLDLYAWLTYRMSYLRKPVTVPWSSLQDQFGFQLAATPQGRHQFKCALTKNLREVLLVYPDANVEATPSGLLLKPSLTHVPMRGMRSLRAAAPRGAGGVPGAV